MHSSNNIHQGYKNYSTYHSGNSPLIFLSQHGGYLEPSDIPNRQPGCWNGTHCIWQHDCDINSSYSQSTENCPVKTLRDGYTQEIAKCLTENTLLNINGNILKPHLIINHLYRGKLDSNREIGEATLFNTDAIRVYNDIHFDFMQRAKTSANNQCGFGLVFDIHGQSKNDFNQMGYRLSHNDLQQSDIELDTKASSSSIYSLSQSVTAPLSSIVRGQYSLGTIMDEAYGYLMVPSQQNPYLDTEYYYQGGFGIDFHGSQYNGTIDAIQIEINSPNRWNETLRDEFCLDFSVAIVDFMNHWYDLSQCLEPVVCSNSDGDNIVNFDFVYKDITDFDENIDGETYLNATVIQFIKDDNECGNDIDALDYYYDFKYKQKRKRLKVSLIVCCGKDAVFDEGYIAPPRYEHIGSDAAFTNEIELFVSDGFGMRQIITFIITGCLVIICCICGIIMFTRYEMMHKLTLGHVAHGEIIDVHSARNEFEGNDHTENTIR